MNNCAFLVQGICPHHVKKCDKPCDKYAVVGDNTEEIFQDWNIGIDELASQLRQKHFGTNEKTKINEIDDFLGL